MGAVFTVLYMLGKLEQWQLLWRSGGPLPQSLAVTVSMQCAIVSVLFLIGFGAGWFISDRPLALTLTRFDAAIAGAQTGAPELVGHRDAAIGHGRRARNGLWPWI